MNPNLTEPPRPAKTLEHVELQAYLQQRYPFLMVDRVSDYAPGSFLHAVKAVTCNEPCFQGHFPDNPVMPGVMIIEALAQAACLLFHLSQTSPIGNSQSLFLATADIQFRKPVVPGDVLHLEVSKPCLLPGAVSVRAKAKLSNDLAAKGNLMLMLNKAAAAKTGI